MPSLLENAVKYGLLTATSPIWWPIAKALWSELQAALWKEGGLIGRAPTAHEIPFLRERYKEFLSPLINESLAEYKAREEREEREAEDEARAGRKGGRKGKADAQPARSAKKSITVRPPGTRKIGGSTAPRSQSSMRPLKPQTKPQAQKPPGSSATRKRRGF